MIPVTIVSGFLGAGKTTLLNNLLRNRLGVRIGVVVNDFGAINIDAMLVAGQVDSTVSLSNGCLCCSTSDNELADMLNTLAARDIDAIVVEASGLAEPVPLVRMVLSAAAGNARLGYGGLVTVVDTVNYHEVVIRHPEVAQHVQLADLVLLNKIDLAQPVEPARSREAIRELNSRAAMVETVNADVDPGLLFDARDRAEPWGQLSLEDLIREEHDHREHAHHRYESVEFSSPMPLHPRRLMEFLDNQPAGIYRMKGIIRIGDRTFAVHTVGDHIGFDPAPHGAVGTTLVAIGMRIDADEVTSRLEATVDDRRDPEDPDLDRTMLLLGKYLR